MKFVVAPDKFKGALSGAEFCNAVEEGIKKALPNAIIIKKPLADGGDGTIQVVKDYLNAEVVFVEVHNPLFKKIPASYLFTKQQKVAFIEMSEASGYKLLTKDELNCKQTTSLGTGELILDAIKRGAKEIILGIGGSATNDGGMGIAVALGYSFLDEHGEPLLPIGANLTKVSVIQVNKVHKLLKNVKVRVACDVTNPFYGAMGAAHIYASQKGASNTDIKILDKGLRNLAKHIQSVFDINVQEIEGSGAAGGIGGGAIAFLGAELLSGIELIKELADFDKAIEGADWIITGEGSLDEQTMSGKTVHGVLKSANKKQIPVAAFCGRVELSTGSAKQLGLDYIVAVSEGMPNLEAALKASFVNVRKAAYKFVARL